MIRAFRFKALDRWDRFTIPHLPIPRDYPVARLGGLFEARCEAVNRDDYRFSDLQPITIHFGGAISKRAVSADRDYSMRLYHVRPNDLVLSKIDLKNGAIGVLPDWTNAVVTGHFAAYKPDTEIVLPRFVRLMLQSDQFRSWLWACRVGADGRTEVKLADFEDLQIPLPPLVEQQALVAAHDAVMAEAEKLQAEAARVEREGVAGFAAALGLVAPPPLPERPMFIARFADLDRWGHEAALRRSLGQAGGGDVAQAAYPLVRLGDVIADLENGWSPQCLDRPARPDEWGVLKLGAVSFGTFEANQNKALPISLAPRPRLEIKQGDVLISRANITRLVGATAYVSQTRGRLLLCDKIFRCVFAQDSVIAPQFVSLVLRTPKVREQIEDKLTGTSPTMKNISKPALLGLTFPLPPLDVQRALVATLERAREIATGLLRDAAAKRAEAKRAFEAALYGDQ